MNTTENNTLIAEFMDVDQVDIDTWLEDNKELKYHSSWDWLMPVVDKIKQYCLYNVEDVGGDYKVVFIDNSGYNPSEQKMFMFSDKDYKKATYKAVVEFIKWYNENKEN